MLGDSNDDKDNDAVEGRDAWRQQRRRHRRCRREGVVIAIVIVIVLIAEDMTVNQKNIRRHFVFFDFRAVPVWGLDIFGWTILANLAGGPANVSRSCERPH